MNTIQTKNDSILSLQNIVISIFLSITTFGIVHPITKANDEFFSAPLKKEYDYYNVIFLKDSKGKKFILKKPRRSKYAIYEALGAKVGNDVGVNINHVKICPPQDPSISSVDEYPNKIKTLHTEVPGKQGWDLENIIRIRYGLTEQTLPYIATHKDLCKIVALDIYLANYDRHPGNFFYDEANDHYHAIDMDMAFRESHNSPYRVITNDLGEKVYPQGLLSSNACSFVESLNKDQLSDKEKHALARINRTLHNLTAQYHPEALYKTRTTLAEEAHYKYSTSEQEEFLDLITYNFQETKRLQKLLDIYKKPISISGRFVAKHMAKPSKLAEENFWQTMHS